MTKEWLSILVDAVRECYSSLFGSPGPAVEPVSREDWEAVLRENGVSLKDRPAVYLVDRILIREDASYFDILHEFGHDAFYQSIGVKEIIMSLKKNPNPERMAQLKSKLPLELIELSATQYARILGASMKDKLPGLLSEYLGGSGAVFAAFNGSVQRTGWGNDLDLLLVFPDETLKQRDALTFPREWDVEVLPESFFQKGVECADGVYIDLAVNGDVLMDKRGFEETLRAYLDRPPTIEEAGYHHNISRALFSLSRERFHMHLYRRHLSEVINEAVPELSPASVLNPLHYSLSYHYLSDEYSRGNRPLISEALETVPSLRLFKAIRKAEVITPDIFSLAEKYLGV